MAGIGLPPRRGARADAAVSDLRPGLDRGRPGHFRPLPVASPGECGADHLESRASPVAFDASWWASLGVAGPGGRTGPLPRRCSQCRPPGRARRPPLPRSGTGRPRVTPGRGRPRPQSGLPLHGRSRSDSGDRLAVLASARSLQLLKIGLLIRGCRLHLAKVTTERLRTVLMGPYRTWRWLRARYG